MADNETIALHEAVPRSDLAYRQFLVASLLLAVLLGFALGLHVATVRLLDSGRPERTADLIQAHGQAQLLGFAGLFVIGMSLRLVPRFAGASLQLQGLLPVVLWSMVLSLLLRGAVMPWFDGTTHHAMLVVATFGVMLAGGAYMLLVAATLTYGARRADAASTAFLLGATVLFAATAIACLAVTSEGSSEARSLAYLPDTAVTQLEIYGFLFVTIIGVGLRALPVLVGRTRPERSVGMLPRLICTAAAVHAGALLLLEYWRYERAVAMTADAALVVLGVCMLAFVWQAGILRPRADRVRPASQPAMWLIRGAFFWLLVAATIDIYCGTKAFAGGELVTQPEFDAARHALGLGLITSLIAGMSMLILPEFAVARQQANPQRWLAPLLAVLLNTAALLRVVPSLATGTLSSDTRNVFVATAGSVAELAMLIFAFHLLRLMWRQRRQHVTH